MSCILLSMCRSPRRRERGPHRVYPAEVWRQFLSDPQKGAAIIDVRPNEVTGGGGELFELVVKEPERKQAQAGIARSSSEVLALLIRPTWHQRIPATHPELLTLPH